MSSFDLFPGSLPAKGPAASAGFCVLGLAFSYSDSANVIDRPGLVNIALTIAGLAESHTRNGKLYLFSGLSIGQGAYSRQGVRTTSTVMALCAQAMDDV